MDNWNILELELRPEAAAALDAVAFPGDPGACEDGRILWLDTAGRGLAKAGSELRADGPGPDLWLHPFRAEAASPASVLVAPEDGAAEALLPRATATFERRHWQLESEDGPIGLERLDGHLGLGDLASGTAPPEATGVGERADGKTADGEAGDRESDPAGTGDGEKAAAGTQTAAGTPLHLLRITAETATAAFVFARRIDRVAPVRLSVLGLAERGEHLRRARRAIKAEPLALRPGDSAGEAFRRVAVTCLRHYRLNEALLLDGGRGDPLHQARVALRRLRSALWIFRPVLAGEDAGRFNTAFRDLAGAFGRARDLDVLSARAGAPARDRLEAARDTAYASVAETLAAAGTRALILDFAAWVEAGDWQAAEAPGAAVRDLSAREFSATALRRLRRRVRRKGEGLTDLSDELRHELRKDAKKLRYAADFFAPLFPAPRPARRHRSFVTALSRLQDQLGDLNDLAAGAAVLDDLGLTPAEAAPPPREEDRAALLDAADRSLAGLLDLHPFWRGT